MTTKIKYTNIDVKDAWKIACVRQIAVPTVKGVRTIGSLFHIPIKDNSGYDLQTIHAELTLGFDEEMKKWSKPRLGETAPAYSVELVSTAVAIHLIEEMYAEKEQAANLAAAQRADEDEKQRKLALLAKAEDHAEATRLMNLTQEEIAALRAEILGKAA